MSPPPIGKNSTAIGNAAEDFALSVMQGEGYRLVERNFRCRGGEIDLIMLSGDELVFTEVRYRAQDGFGDGGESVDRHKQRRLRIAAETWLQTNPDFDFRYCRFDVFSVTGAAPDFEYEWIDDAF